MIRRLWPFAILILMPRMFNADMGFALCFVVRMSLWGTPSIPRDPERHGGRMPRYRISKHTV